MGTKEGNDTNWGNIQQDPKDHPTTARSTATLLPETRFLPTELVVKKKKIMHAAYGEKE